MLDADSTGNIDSVLAYDDIEPLNDLEAILDRVLDAQPELAAVAGDWDLLCGIEEQVSVMYIHVVPLTKFW